uniref:RNA helicase n=1 Tax=Ixodes ricinus TaxID=34613 RepID=A0A0K8RGQ5_IXORI
MTEVQRLQSPERDPTFEDLQLKKWIIDQLNSLGIKKPSPVQQNCIPSILKGKDCIGCAKTGSGKTLAFALPILQKLFEDPYGIFALVLTPTRELAFQISEQFKVIGKAVGLKDCVIVGGMDMVTQGRLLAESPHVVVSTPGRLADHLESCNTFTLGRIKFLVLDEADRLLEGHFNEQLKTIFFCAAQEPADAAVQCHHHENTGGAAERCDDGPFLLHCSGGGGDGGRAGPALRAHAESRARRLPRARAAAVSELRPKGLRRHLHKHLQELPGAVHGTQVSGFCQCGAVYFF